MLQRDSTTTVGALSDGKEDSAHNERGMRWSQMNADYCCTVLTWQASALWATILHTNSPSKTLVVLLRAIAKPVNRFDQNHPTVTIFDQNQITSSA